MRALIFLFLMLITFSCFLNAQQWKLQQTGTETPFFDLFFIDTLHGWIVGDSGMILHTSNERVTWIQENIDQKLYRSTRKYNEVKKLFILH